MKSFGCNPFERECFVQSSDWESVFFLAVDFPISQRGAAPLPIVRVSLCEDSGGFGMPATVKHLFVVFKG